MKSSASESKPFQSRSKAEISGRARRVELLSRSKLKQAFLIDSDAELFMSLIQCITWFGSCSAFDPSLRYCFKYETFKWSKSRITVEEICIVTQL